MIESINFNLDKMNNIDKLINKDSTLFNRETIPYNKIKIFKNLKNPEINFGKGLNIIVGDNGYGKSSLINLIASMTFSKQGGISFFSNEGTKILNENLAFFFSNLKYDGESVSYINPFATNGLLFHGAAFDYDFFEKCKNTMSNYTLSSGEKTLFELEMVGNEKFKFDKTKTLSKLLKIIESICERSYIKYSDDVKHYKIIKENLLKTYEINLIPKGNNTIIIDEFERSVSILNQRKILNDLKRKADEENIQIITSSHSIFSLMYLEDESVNFIGDLNYLKKLKKEFSYIFDK